MILSIQRGGDGGLNLAGSRGFPGEINGSEQRGKSVDPKLLGHCPMEIEY